jgi:hypothetical protein
MSDPHDEEYQAEVRTCVLRCGGRLEGLRRARLLERQSALTEAGWNKYRYRKLVAAGQRQQGGDRGTPCRRG